VSATINMKISFFLLGINPVWKTTTFIKCSFFFVCFDSVMFYDKTKITGYMTMTELNKMPLRQSIWQKQEIIGRLTDL
jgi:hypothetical protein